MLQQTRAFIFIGVITVVVICLLYFLYRNLKAEELAILELKLEYEKAIKAGDKSLALELGREYYSRQRGGYLTVYDEQAIANDLSIIK